MNTKKITTLLLLPLLILMAASSAQAIPAFANKENLDCSSCHSVLPALNGYGRNYKLLGYVRNDQDRPARPDPRRNTPADTISNFPVSAGIIARPYDKKDSGETKIRAIHEIELMVAGNIADKVSGFVELEAEDEEDFEVEVSLAQGTYAYSPALNFQISRAPALYFDPFNSYTNGRRVTINRNAVIDNSFGGADNGSSLRRNRQNLTVFGNISGLFYGASYSGVANDNEGKDASTFIGRLAYEFTPSFMVGAMMIEGSCTMDSGGGDNSGDPCFLADRDYSRWAIDTEWTGMHDNLILNAVYMQADDDQWNGFSSDSNNAYYVQAFYRVLKEGKLNIAPLFRYDSYEQNNGQYSISSWTAGLSWFMHENVKLRAEFSDLSGEGPVADDDRLTFQIDAFF